jgi:patatin-like phospholipase/acyl hydrolase
MKHILSIDGGGIRGVIPAAILAHIEQRLIHSTNNRDAALVHFFDLFAGTSTGGILSALYIVPEGKTRSSGNQLNAEGSALRPKYSAQQVLEFYRELGPVLFRSDFSQKLKSLWGFRGSKYSVEPLEKFARKLFGDTYISEALRDCLITSYDMTSRKAHLFSLHSTQKYGSSADYRLADVVRSTSAAPTFFEPALICAADKGQRHLIDGGVYSNNPGMCAYVEAIKLWEEISPQEELLISLGTGKIEKPYLYEKTVRFGYLQWLFPVIDVLMSSVAEVVDFQLKQIFLLAKVPENYIRIEPQLTGCSIRMDNASPRNISALEDVAHRYIDHNGEEIDNIVHKLSLKEN